MKSDISPNNLKKFQAIFGRMPPVNIPTLKTGHLLIRDPLFTQMERLEYPCFLKLAVSGFSTQIFGNRNFNLQSVQLQHLSLFHLKNT